MCKEFCYRSYGREKNMENVIFVDTNIWCYYFNEKASEHTSCSAFIDKALASSAIASNTIIIMELAHFLIKNLGETYGKQKINEFLSLGLIIDDVDYTLCLDSIENLSKYSNLGIGGRDSTIISSMNRLRIRKLASHDLAFKKIKDIEVLDPIKKRF